MPLIEVVSYNNIFVINNPSVMEKTKTATSNFGGLIVIKVEKTGIFMPQVYMLCLKTDRSTSPITQIIRVLIRLLKKKLITHNLDSK